MKHTCLKSCPYMPKEWAYMPTEWAYHTIPYKGPGLKRVATKALELLTLWFALNFDPDPMERATDLKTKYVQINK